ncbi:MAG: hypothetical protein IKB93_11655 [Clostridia bacterium]|nr:hypothetical protein [Clostridia bacterium]
MKTSKTLTKNYIVGLILAAAGALIFAEGTMFFLSIIAQRIKEGIMLYENGIYNITDVVIFAFGEIIGLLIIAIGIYILYIAAIKAEISIVKKVKKRKKAMLHCKCFKFQTAKNKKSR